MERSQERIEKAAREYVGGLVRINLLNGYVLSPAEFEEELAKARRRFQDGSALDSWRSPL